MNGGAPGSAAVERELFTQRFASLAREMGEMLRRTALSTNVKERLDFSCALLDPDGRLVVNAPHIPVHLGALGLCVRRCREALPMGPGDVVVTNHPAFGGSHLPDVTVITPVYAGEVLLGYTASRAHHAEIGGIRPGSMPPAARCLGEEGVVIPPTYLLRAGEPRWGEIERLLRGSPHPSRAVEENLADLAAAVAANRRGAQGLRELVATHSREVVLHFMAELAAEAARRSARALRDLFARRGIGPGQELRAVETLDDGATLAVTIRPVEVSGTSREVSGTSRIPTVGHIERGRQEGSFQPEGASRPGESFFPPGPAAEPSDEPSGTVAVIDFTGTSGTHPGNLNAPPAVTRSAVLYVLRLLIDEDLPLNEGLLAPVELRIPEGMLNPTFPEDPFAAPAVVGGNVETSQRVVDTLLAAFGVVAGSQGTMNNLLFGDGRFGYYETVAGGTGAGPGFAGASAVHSHMTNTRITDPEILEHRYPVRLHRFAVRRGSGGAGRWPGGDGVVRELEFLAPMSLSLLTQHRTAGPRGAAGGGDGQPGRQRLVRGAGVGKGAEIELASIDGREVEAGDRLILETPGGGGWGVPEEADQEGKE